MTDNLNVQVKKLATDLNENGNPIVPVENTEETVLVYQATEDTEPVD